MAHRLTATETRLAVGQGQVRTVVPVPRGGDLPFLGSPVLPPVRLTGGFCRADQTVPRQDVNSSFSPAPRVPLRDRGCSHTRWFGTLAGPPPPVTDPLRGPHLPCDPLISMLKTKCCWNDDSLDTTRSTELSTVQVTVFPFWANCGVSPFSTQMNIRVLSKVNEAVEPLAFHLVIALSRTDRDRGQKTRAYSFYLHCPSHSQYRHRVFGPSPRSIPFI